MSLRKFLPVASLFGLATAQSDSYINQTACNGKTYTYQALGGYGYIPGTARDKFGDTIGGIGSAIAMDRKNWEKLDNGSYTGVLWALPDRGWFVAFQFSFCPWSTTYLSVRKSTTKFLRVFRQESKLRVLIDITGIQKAP